MEWAIAIVSALCALRPSWGGELPRSWLSGGAEISKARRPRRALPSVLVVLTLPATFAVVSGDPLCRALSRAAGRAGD